MATAEAVQHPAAHERPVRRRPFSNWMKKLAHFKNSSTTDGNQSSNTKRGAYQMKSQSKKNGNKSNNPYLGSAPGNGASETPVDGHLSFSTGPTGQTVSTSSLEQSTRSFHSSVDGASPPTIGNRSVAHTASTEQDAAHSELAQSHGASSGAGTTGTIGGGLSTGRSPDSTFSSPAPSLRSLATTLTTIQSAAAGTGGSVNAANGIQSGSQGAQNNNLHANQFTHQFPTSNPVTAIPAHLAPQGSGGHPATYSTATANNLLTDNASIMTLASSSRRRRRRSMDTDASVRALAPSSLFGGSRESLPLSVLSTSIDPHGTVSPSGMHQSRPSVGGPAAERASIYSSTGVAPALPSDRNSYYAGKQSVMGDGGSVKSGFLGHGRTDSVNGSIGGIASASSPLASPRESGLPAPGRLSRRNSALSAVDDTHNESEKEGTVA
ncbi:MAG: hypothetical protein M1818_006776 [Claussenomyces sp. TS43310]|nr:MAG: hypothetical protein M1818_006776 [Claussenomyces sp. TS43310]